MRHCYPIREWVTTDEKEDVYHSLHHHGVAVESELMAYRIYFDKKQTIDPYCKRKPQLELAQSYWYPNDSLLAAGYGDDILRVSGTVGVGSVKYWNGKKMVHIEPVAERSQRIVQSKRDQATIEVAVKGWQIEDKMVNMVSAVRFTSVLLASWGTDWPVNDSAKYAKETVGLGVFIPKEFAGECVHDKQNNMCLLHLTAKRSEMCRAHFYLTCVGATKANHPVATSAEEWFAYLRRWASRLK